MRELLETLSENMTDEELEDTSRIVATKNIPLERLIELCAAENDGRLVVLPCKVGDTVYHLTSDSPTGIEETKVFQIRLSKGSYRALCKCVYDDWGNARWEFGPNDFGKTVFLTREEAEAAMKGGGE